MTFDGRFEGVSFSSKVASFAWGAAVCHRFGVCSGGVSPPPCRSRSKLMHSKLPHSKVHSKSCLLVLIDFHSLRVIS